MINNFSISFLQQAFDAVTDLPLNHFEHIIVLHKFPKEISKEKIIETIKEKNYLEPYETAYGDHIYWKTVKILDVYELIDDITFENNAEVYSRHFIEDKLDLNEILEKYFSDLVWEDD